MSRGRTLNRDYMMAPVSSCLPEMLTVAELLLHGGGRAVLRLA